MSYNSKLKGAEVEAKLDKIDLLNAGMEDTEETVEDVVSLPFVSYNEQSLTEEQKEQARKNIGAMSTDELFDEDKYAYGVEFDTNVSSPTCTRIGNMALHRTLPVQSLMRGCLLDDNGNVVEYLDQNDWTKNTLNGSKGQVMVEIPQHYRRFAESGTIRQVWLSLKPLFGYHVVPKCYVSAYRATVQRSTLKLASVKNTSTDYRGGDNTSNWDGTYRSLLGLPATNISRTNFRAYARKRKPSTYEWNCMTYDIQKTLCWLFVTEYATLNSQAGYNAQLNANGFRQGGLGAGATTLDNKKWRSYNTLNPFIPCGFTDSLGNNTGVIEYTMPSQYNSTTTKVQVSRYRGVENPFGLVWDAVDGINACIGPTLSKIYICSNPSNFTDDGYDGYKYVGDAAVSDGYINKTIFGENGEIIASGVSGGSTTYCCDYHYTSIPSSEALRAVIFSAGGASGTYAGFFCVNLTTVPSLVTQDLGTRLCFIPL